MIFRISPSFASSDSVHLCFYTFGIHQLIFIRGYSGVSRSWNSRAGLFYFKILQNYKSSPFLDAISENKTIFFSFQFRLDRTLCHCHRIQLEYHKWWHQLTPLDIQCGLVPRLIYFVILYMLHTCCTNCLNECAINRVEVDPARIMGSIG